VRRSPRDPHDASTDQLTDCRQAVGWNDDQRTVTDLVLERAHHDLFQLLRSIL